MEIKGECQDKVRVDVPGRPRHVPPAGITEHGDNTKVARAVAIDGKPH